MSDLKGMPMFVLLLLLIGMITAVGILTFDSFGEALRDDTTVTAENITIAGGAGTTANTPVNAVTTLTNGTLTCNTWNVAGSCGNWTAAGAITLNASFGNNSYNITYEYWANSTTTDTMEDMVNATSPITGTWLALIVTIAALAIILSLIVYRFVGRN